MTKTVPITSHMSVADLITYQIEASGKLQAQIAKEVGFEKPNIITMIKQGATKLPLAKVGPMARALGMDPIYLFAVVMKEYMPDTWEAVEALQAQPTLTSNEIEIVMALREAGLPTHALGQAERGNIVRAIKPALPK